MYITPRTLLAIIRISQSMAKFQFRDHVTQWDVDHAIKLMDYSFETLEKEHREEQRNNRRERKYPFISLPPSLLTPNSILFINY